MFAVFWRLIDQWADSQWATRLGFIGDLMDVISLMITILFTGIVLNLRKYLMNERDKQQEDYRLKRQQIIDTVGVLHKNLCEDQLFQNSAESKRHVIGEALRAFYTYKRNYNRLLDKDDRMLLEDAISILKQLQDLNFNSDEATVDALLNSLNDKLSNIESMFQDLRLNV